MRNVGVAVGAALATVAARAHEGHGVDGSHWHATDALGFVVVGVVAAGLAWWMRRK
jgi:hypothetical protein